jgi:mannose-6-phosphate isomerase-like protein (cupin superfamily)
MAYITLNGTIKDYSVGETAIIPSGMRHRVKNPFEKSLTYIQVQHRTFFVKYDIVRIEDDYQRA